MDLPEIDNSNWELDETERTIEALIAASDKPVEEKLLLEVVRDYRFEGSKKGAIEVESELGNIVMKINTVYERFHNAFRIEKVAGGYQHKTRPEFEPAIRKYLHPIKQQRLSKPALETLAVIAYRQPVVKSEVERIRGVAADGVIRNLLDKKLVTITGRASGPGKPLLYSTTDKFLEYFGLDDISELPGEKEIELLLGRPKSTPTAKITMKREGEEAQTTEETGDEQENGAVQNDITTYDKTSEHEARVETESPGKDDDIEREDENLAEIEEETVRTE
ncbi:MAG: SMC-Scp complex subunit ScpB [candidate division Zixibacteria bacterium]|nr:SMC-Scp complex subunit ScpB [candidate division Zixibacteria bacterium]